MYTAAVAAKCGNQTPDSVSKAWFCQGCWNAGMCNFVLRHPFSIFQSIMPISIRPENSFSGEPSKSVKGYFKMIRTPHVKFQHHQNDVSRFGFKGARLSVRLSPKKAKKWCPKMTLRILRGEPLKFYCSGQKFIAFPPAPPPKNTFPVLPRVPQLWYCGKGKLEFCRGNLPKVGNGTSKRYVITPRHLPVQSFNITTSRTPSSR